MFWFRINPSELSQNEITILHSEIPRLRTELELDLRRSQSKLTPEDVYRITYRLTGSMEKAEQEEAKFMLRTTKNGKI